MTSPRHKWMIFNLGALFLLQQVHLNGKLEQESSSTFLLYPLKSDSFYMRNRPGYFQGSICKKMQQWAFDHFEKNSLPLLKLPPQFPFTLKLLPDFAILLSNI